MRLMKQLALAGVLGLSVAAGLGGCASNEASIPSSAFPVKEGTGRLDYSPPRAGMVYVVDKSTGEVAYTGMVHRGDVVLVNPADSTVRVAGSAVHTTTSINPDHRYEIRWDPRDGVSDTSSGSDGRVIERTTVIERPAP